MAMTFAALVAEFKQSQMKSARKCFSNAKAKPNSRVAAMIDEESHQRLLESLVPSSGTLIVVPSVLVEHWKVRGLTKQLYTSCFVRKILTIYLVLLAGFSGFTGRRK